MAKKRKRPRTAKQKAAYHNLIKKSFVRTGKALAKHDPEFLKRVNFHEK